MKSKETALSIEHRRFDDLPKVGNKRVLLSETDSSAATYQRLTNRMSTKRGRIERKISVIIIGAGLIAGISGSLGVGLSICVWIVGIALYFHSCFVALWSDEG